MSDLVPVSPPRSIAWSTRVGIVDVSVLLWGSSVRIARGQTSRVYTVEARPCGDKQGAAVLAAQDEAGRTLRNLDGVDPPAGGVEDKDLAGGDVHVALTIDRDAFAALLGK